MPAPNLVDVHGYFFRLAGFSYRVHQAGHKTLDFYLFYFFNFVFLVIQPNALGFNRICIHPASDPTQPLGFNRLFLSPIPKHFLHVSFNFPSDPALWPTAYFLVFSWPGIRFP